jgi:hypothetical protein
VPFAGAVKETVPGPVPLPPEVIATHEALDDADHAQPPAVVTETVSEPPAGGMDTLVRETL